MEVVERAAVVVEEAAVEEEAAAFAEDVVGDEDAAICITTAKAIVNVKSADVSPEAAIESTVVSPEAAIELIETTALARRLC